MMNKIKLCVFILISLCLFVFAVGISQYFLRSRSDHIFYNDVNYVPYLCSYKICYEEKSDEHEPIFKLPEGAITHEDISQLECFPCVQLVVMPELSSQRHIAYRIVNNSNKELMYGELPTTEIFKYNGDIWLPISIDIRDMYFNLMGFIIHPNEYSNFGVNVYDGFFGFLQPGEYVILHNLIMLQSDNKWQDITVAGRFTLPFTDYIHSNISQTPTELNHEKYITDEQLTQIKTQTYLSLTFAPEFTSQHEVALRLYNPTANQITVRSTTIELYKRYDGLWLSVPIIHPSRARIGIPEGSINLPPHYQAPRRVNFYNGIYGHLSAGEYLLIEREMYWTYGVFEIGDTIVAVAHFSLPFIIPITNPH